MTLTYDPDVDGVGVNHHAKYLLQRSLSSKQNSLSGHTDRQTHTERKDCSTWTTRLVGNNSCHEEQRDHLPELYME